MGSAKEFGVAIKAAKVIRWIEVKRERQERLALCSIPGHSPELNPDELLHGPA